MEISGSRALITGGARRLGKFFAIELAKMGADVIIHFFSSQREAQATKKHCEKAGVNVELIKCDFSSLQNIAPLLRTVRRCSILVNNASSFYKVPIEKINYAEIIKNINVNFVVHFLLIKEMWLEASTKGRQTKVINILDAERTRRNFIPYHIGKVLLQYTTEELAKFFAPQVIINGIALGPILPPPGKSTSQLLKISEKTLLKRPGTIQEVLSAFLFLLNNDYIVGQVIYIAGGGQLT